ncbi:magnesium/cobalt transporter CorA [Marisediminicola antarctica]|uniref:Magnesium transport protein CorA n=1 Tax=Marisediminicola antarctica TaxID=674079 RepID=A0A7L5ANL7_9MICO|nr:magnesium/cobalt transporter CorA [Marisediminicola antarctica]QHO70711.1 magnesium and cobalt transport protein CorA [Marisediminicola antarctica]
MASDFLKRFRGFGPARKSTEDQPEPVQVAATAPELRASHVVDNAVYLDGVRIASPSTVHETVVELDRKPRSLGWVGLYRPDAAELHELARQFGLHELTLEDAINARQRPKVERYDGITFLVLKAARYVDETETVEFGELHLFVGPNFVITLRHAEAPDLRSVRSRLEADPELLARGTDAILYGILDAVVDGYRPVVEGLENDIAEIEAQVFDGHRNVSRRIYELTREVIEFQLAVLPLADLLDTVKETFDQNTDDPALRQYLRDVADHVARVSERVDRFRQLLRDILTVNATLVAQRQNDEMQRVGIASNLQADQTRKISGWAAILFAPSLIGSLYGMNFRYMPELEWYYGYPFAIALMLAVSGALYVIFRGRDWI